MKRILISGASGFVGHHLTSYVLENTDWEVIAVDRLLSVLSRKRFNDLNLSNEERITSIHHDFGERFSQEALESIGDIDYIFHFGAETSVEKSLIDPYAFIKTNIIGTQNLLNLALKQENLHHFFYVSTNEVFGNATPNQKFREWENYNCFNPYSATKAAAEELCLAYSSSYQIPILIIRTMNLFGERDNPEKFIPRAVRSLLLNEKIPVYVSPSGEIGSRAYLLCSEFISAMFFIIGVIESNSSIDWNRNIINIAGDVIIDNIALAKKIAEIMNKSFSNEMIDYYYDESISILHSALDCSKLHKLGWHPRMSFDEQLEYVVRWLVNNVNWPFD